MTEPERTIATARVIAASPEQVYAAFVVADRLARWWGPKGFRNTFQEFEPRPGVEPGNLSLGEGRVCAIVRARHGRSE